MLRTFLNLDTRLKYPATFHGGRSLQCKLDRRLVGPRRVCSCFGEQKSHPFLRSVLYRMSSPDLQVIGAYLVIFIVLCYEYVCVYAHTYPPV